MQARARATGSAAGDRTRERTHVLALLCSRPVVVLPLEQTYMNVPYAVVGTSREQYVWIRYQQVECAGHDLQPPCALHGHPMYWDTMAYAHFPGANASDTAHQTLITGPVNLCACARARTARARTARPGRAPALACPRLPSPALACPRLPSPALACPRLPSPALACPRRMLTLVCCATCNVPCAAV
jgi:hypothetical protein